MNIKLYKLIFSVAFTLQVTSFNLGYSTDNNDIRFIATEHGDCYIEKSGKLLSVNENDQNKFNLYKGYDIDTSNCIAHVIKDVNNEYNGDIYSDLDDNNDEIVALKNFFRDIKIDKYNDEHQEEYYKQLIQNNCNHDDIGTISIGNINIDNILNTNKIESPTFELKPNLIDIEEELKKIDESLVNFKQPLIIDINEEFKKITDESLVNFKQPLINAIGGSYTEKITTYTMISEYKLPDNIEKDLLSGINYNCTGRLSGTSLFVPNKQKTCCDCLVNIFKKATSCIKNVFNSNTNASNNNMIEKLINNDIEDNNYDADISSSENSENDSSTNNNKGSIEYNSDNN